MPMVGGIKLNDAPRKGKAEYRELAGRITRAMILEDGALAVLKKDQLSLDDRETLEKVVQIARTLKKIRVTDEEL
jgi:hypothetical protein